MIVATHEMAFRARGRGQGVLPRRGRDLRGRTALADLLRAAGGADRASSCARDRGGAAVIARIRRAPKAPLSVAGILATPLFFVCADGVLAEAGRADRRHASARAAPRCSATRAKSTVATDLSRVVRRLCSASCSLGIVGSFVRRARRRRRRGARRHRHLDRHPAPARQLGGRAHGALSAGRRPHPEERAPSDLFLRRGSGRRTRRRTRRAARVLDDRDGDRGDRSSRSAIEVRRRRGARRLASGLRRRRPWRDRMLASGRWRARSSSSRSGSASSS